MNVIIDGKNIKNSFIKIIKRIIKQYIALELLKQNGFDEKNNKMKRLI
jgi:hypothetical protein